MRERLLQSLNSLDVPKRFLHRLVSNPHVYDLVQLLAGSRQTDRRLAQHFAALSFPGARVLDLGGGTGLLRRLWPQSCLYICLDLERPKLQGFRGKYPDGLAVLADGTRLPLQSASLDIVLCSAVSHHLNAEQLPRLLDEAARVLKDGGTFLFFDAVWAPHRLWGCLLWKYDRGSYPRDRQTLRTALTAHFCVTHEENFVIYHEFLLCRAAKRAVSEPHSQNELRLR